ncbi:TRAP transporter small permease [Natrialba swarupiae]
MCASVGLQVFNRLILTEIGMNFIWTASLGQFLMIITTFIGAGLASRDREHVRINYVLKRLPKSITKLLAIVSRVLILIFLFVLIVGGVQSFTYNIGSQFHILPQYPPFTREWLALSGIVGAGMMSLYVLRDLYIIMIKKELDTVVFVNIASEGDQ